MSDDLKNVSTLSSDARSFRWWKAVGAYLLEVRNKMKLYKCFAELGYLKELSCDFFYVRQDNIYVCFSSRVMPRAFVG